MNPDLFQPLFREIAFVVIVCVVLSVLWVGDVVGNLIGRPLLPNPTGEPLTPVYVLDLGFVIPAGFYGAIQLLRKRFWGYVVTGIMLVTITTMGFALMAMTVGAYVFGFGLDDFLTVFWAVLGTIGITLSLAFLGNIHEPHL